MKKLGFFLLISIFFLNTKSDASLNKFNTQNNPYLEMSLGYAQNISGGNASDIKIYQSPYQPFPPAVSKLSNSNNPSGFNIGFGGGYVWKLFDQWSWGLGAQIRHFEITQRGNQKYIGSDRKSQYQYVVSETDLSAIARIIYNYKRLHFYIETHVGSGFVESNNYVNNVVNDKYKNKLTTHLSYGGGLGINYFLSPVTSIGLSADITDFGKARLGPLKQLEGKTIGEIIQKQVVLATNLKITHWF